MTAARLEDYIDHIHDAIGRIQSYVAGLDSQAFAGNDLVQDAVIRNIEVIGEACHRIEVRYPEFARAHPEIPLSSAYQMRNAVAHGYFEIDWDIVWLTIITDLPSLGHALREAIVGPAAGD